MCYTSNFYYDEDYLDNQYTGEYNWQNDFSSYEDYEEFMSEDWDIYEEEQ